MKKTIEAGKSANVPVIGRFFECKSATKPFVLHVKGDRLSYDIDIAEGDSFTLPDGQQFTSLGIDNTAEENDDLRININALPFPIVSQSMRVPPTSFTGGKVTVVEGGDAEKKGVRDNKRRKQIAIYNSGAANSITIQNDGNDVWLLTPGQGWTFETDGNITFLNKAGQTGEAVDVYWHETFYLE